MAFSMSWHIPERIMLLKVTGQVTTDDVKQINQLVIDSHSSHHYMVHQIIDITEMTKPPGFGALRQHTHVTDVNDGYVVIVGHMNRMVEFIMVSVTQLKNIRLIVVDTLDEAIAELVALDPSLQTAESIR
jgi:hypothetical protein